MLAKGIQIVGVLFAAFGGFLLGLAPPEEADAKFAVGVSSFTALIVLFLLAALMKRQHKKFWITFAITCSLLFLASGYIYRTNYNRLTFEFPPGSPTVEYIAGTTLTPDAQNHLKANPGLSASQLLADFGGLSNKRMVWTADSISSARMILITNYVVVVLTLSCAIFSLAEEEFGKE